MMINALNSGARVFMADFEDALSPAVDQRDGGPGQLHGRGPPHAGVHQPGGQALPPGRAARHPGGAAAGVAPGREARAGGRRADVGQLCSTSASTSSTTPASCCARGSGPYFYLPKLENHLEARLWNEVFDLAQDALGIPRGTIRATVLIETILAAFEMDEILYELRDHAAGLNAGRWDYLFSIIKNFRDRPEFLLPDRSQLTMTVPFMRAYTELLVQTCHRRGAHAIGGMAAFIPSRRDAQVNADRARQGARGQGPRGPGRYDGAWVAHPDLVPVVEEVFGAVLGDRPNQKDRQRDDVQVTARAAAGCSGARAAG